MYILILFLIEFYCITMQGSMFKKFFGVDLMYNFYQYLKVIKHININYNIQQKITAEKNFKFRKKIFKK